MFRTTTALRHLLPAVAIISNCLCTVCAQNAKAPEQPPATWEMALGEKAQPLWDRLRADGKVTAAEILSANGEPGDADTGAAQATTAWLLLGLDEDPIPALREMMKGQDADQCAFAVSTAAALGDVRLLPDLDTLGNDTRKLGHNGTRALYKETTIGRHVEHAVAELVRGGVLAGDREEGSDIRVPSWLQSVPPVSAELDGAAAGAWLAFSAAEKASKVAYRRDLAAALSTASEVEVLLLDSNEKGEDPYVLQQNRQPTDRFPIMPNRTTVGILKQRTLTAEEIKALIPLLQATIVAEQSGAISLCHQPIHGLRVCNGRDYYGRRQVVFQSSICYHCQNFYFTYPSGPAEWLFLTTPEFQKMMEHLMPIPK